MAGFNSGETEAPTTLSEKLVITKDEHNACAGNVVKHKFILMKLKDVAVWLVWNPDGWFTGLGIPTVPK